MDGPDRTGRWLRFTLTLVLTAAGAGSVPGQQRTEQAAARAGREEGRAAVALRDARAEYIQATEEYRKSLLELLAIREKGCERESLRLDRLRGLYAEGLVTRRELKAAEESLSEAASRREEVRLLLEGADHFLAEALLENERTEAHGARPFSAASKGVVLKSALTRFNGSGSWLLSDAWRVESFFAARFGRKLPVSAYGQSDLHARWGFDHRQSLDVGLHPDSPEGQALIAYLRDAGIPFIAFRSAVPGSATGPHIHIGRPSQRLRGR